jgi:hypothetical protein
MITCRDCVHFDSHFGNAWIGHCALKLPDWIIAAINAPDYIAREVRADGGCDLGELK